MTLIAHLFQFEIKYLVKITSIWIIYLKVNGKIPKNNTSLIANATIDTYTPKESF